MSGIGSTNVSMNPEVLADSEEQMKLVIGEMDAWRKSLAQRDESLASNWKGKSGDSFLRAGVTLEMDYQKVMESFLQEKNLIRTYRETHLQLDQEYAGKFDSVGEGSCVIQGGE